MTDSLIGNCGCSHWQPQCEDCEHLMRIVIDAEIAQNQAMSQWKQSGGVYYITDVQSDEINRLNKTWSEVHHQYMVLLHPELFS